MSLLEVYKIEAAVFRCIQELYLLYHQDHQQDRGHQQHQLDPKEDKLKY